MGLFGSAPEAPEPDMLPQFREAGWAAGGLARHLLQNRDVMTPYAGDRVADLSGSQRNIINQLTQRGLTGSATTDAAQTYAQDVLGGRYLGQQNPYLKDAMAALQDQIGRAVGDQFAGSATAGSPNHYQDLAGEFSRASAPLLFQDYQNERQRMDQMAGLAPTLANTDIAGLNTALGAQGILQQQRQQEMDAERALWDERKSKGVRKLQAVQGAVGGNMGVAGGYGGSPGSAGLVSGLLGGVSSGAMAGSMFGPWGMMAGGILGGAGGAFANR